MVILPALLVYEDALVESRSCLLQSRSSGAATCDAFLRLSVKDEYKGPDDKV